MYVTTNSLYESIGTLIDSNFIRTEIFEINRIPQIITKRIKFLVGKIYLI